jgi:penicillin amidase
MIAADSPWCDDIRTRDAVESCGELPGKAFEAAVDVLRQKYGADASTWRWGDAHQATFRHPLLSRLPLGGMLFDRAIAADGGDRTLNRGASYRRGAVDGVFDDVHGPGLRALHDFAGTPSRYMIAPGQSGNPLSPHYDDLLRRWRDGVMIGFDAEVTQTLRLLPAAGAQNR